MPFTPYHFGPNGFFGLVFRKWIDLPIFLLANVIVDIEVLFADSRMVHRHWHFHTFLVGGAVCAGFAILMYPARGLIGKIMRLIRLPYETGLWKMIFSGILGAWFHVLIDSIYHFDVQPFWPRPRNPFRRILNHDQVKLICFTFIVAAIVLYLYTIVKARVNNRPGEV